MGKVHGVVTIDDLLALLGSSIGQRLFACPYCGTVVSARLENQVTCGRDACRQAAVRARASTLSALSNQREREVA